MVQAVPSIQYTPETVVDLEMQYDGEAMQAMREALAEQFQKIDKIIAEMKKNKSAFSSLKEKMSPPMAIKNIFCALHSLLTNTGMDWVTWFAAKQNPAITGDKISINSLHLDDLSYTRLVAIKAGAQPDNLIKQNYAAELVRRLFVQLQEFVELKK